MLLLHLLPAALAAPPSALPARNVLLIIADDLGVDKVGVYAADNPAYALDAADTLPETPTIDGLAAAGVRFTNAWSNPTCSPTRAAIFTGRHGFRTGVGEASGGTDRPVLALEEVTFAETLSDDGRRGGDGRRASYTAALFGKWHLGTAGDRPSEFTDDVVREQGFATYRGAMANTQSSFYEFDKVVDGSWLESPVTTYITQDTVDDTLAWIHEQPEPWVATVALQAPHSVSAHHPYEPPPFSCLPEDVDPDADDIYLYKALVECLDAELAVLLAGIDPATLDRTTVLFVGDNGTAGDVIDDAFPVRGSKGGVYEGGVNVPFIIADGHHLGGGSSARRVDVRGQVVDPGRTEETPVHVVDLFATMTSIAGVRATEGVDSVSLVPLLEGARPLDREIIYTESFGVRVTEGDSVPRGNLALRSRRFKLIVAATWPADPCVDAFTYDRFSLYDLALDPNEAVDLLDGSLTDAQQDNYDRLYAELLALHQAWVDEACGA